MRNVLPRVGFVISLLALAGPVLAQLDPSLAVESWKPGVAYWADTYDEPTFINGGHDRRSGEDVDIFFWDSTGRVKLDRNDPDPRMWFGYRVLAMDIRTDAPDFKTGLMDVAVVGAFKLFETDDHAMTLIGGAGTANDMHFGNTEAIYGLATVDFARKLDADSALHFGIYYNGNRTLLPDIPLPYVEFRQKVDDSLQYTVGVPRSKVEWRPTQLLLLTGQYEFPTNALANASWFFTDHLSVFGEYRRSLDGFYIDDENNTRLFYERNQVAAGVRIQTKWIDARLGAGWEFGQEFSTGFDLRGLNTVMEPSDRPVLFITLQGTF